MAQLNNQVVGLIRFSYLAKSGGWNIKVSNEKHKEELFSKQRMALRFRLFETLTVPSLAYQTDKDFKCIVLCSDQMPDAFTERLLDCLEGHENLIFMSLPPLPHHSAAATAFERLKNETAQLFTGFRLDDDDMLQKTYIENLKDKIERAGPFIEPNKPLITSFNFGLFLEKTKGGNQVFDVIERTPGAQGTAMTTYIDESRTIFSRNHRKLPAYFRTISHIDGPAWLRTVHSNNIADPKITGRDHLIEKDRITQLLDTHFGLSMDMVSALKL